MGKTKYILGALKLTKMASLGSMVLSIGRYTIFLASLTRWVLWDMDGGWIAGALSKYANVVGLGGGEDKIGKYHSPVTTTA